MAITLTDEFEDTWPQEHTRRVEKLWPMECVEGICEHDSDDLDGCPGVMEAICADCTAMTADYEGPVILWPCENAAVQAWQRAGGDGPRSYETVAEAFLRGWNDHHTASVAERLTRAAETTAAPVTPIPALTPVDEIIERAAIAAFHSTGPMLWGGEWDEADEAQRDRWRTRARAALTSAGALAEEGS